MMTPWDLFDLESAVDARSIKRRYAELLKQYRPDDDPLAFQRLRDAYEYALEWVDIPDPDLDTIAAPAGFPDLVLALPRLNMAENAPVMNIEPVASLLLGWGLLGQTLAPIQLVGGAVVLSAIVWLAKGK